MCLCLSHTVRGREEMGADVIESYLKAVADMIGQYNGKGREGWRYKSPAQFILENGKHYTASPLPRGVKLGPMKQCYTNSLKLALRNKAYTYVEGYAVYPKVPVPLEHAWCIDKEERVVDRTWHYEEGTEYFGVPFTADQVKRA